MAHYQAQLNKAAVTMEALQQLFAERNIPEIKKFIESYVVIIYLEHVKLILELKSIENENP